MFHINPQTGNPGRCTAGKGNCPYGDLSVHYTSEDAARKAFESSMAGEQLSAIRKNEVVDFDAYPKLKQYEKLITPESEVFVHPQGKVVITDGKKDFKVYKNGKPATTSGTLADFRSGRGAWKLAKDAVGGVSKSDASAVKAEADARLAKGWPATSKLNPTAAPKFEMYDETFVGSRFNSSSILPLSQRGNPHRDIVDNPEKFNFWDYTNRDGETRYGDFEVWSDGNGHYKAVTTSGRLYALGSKSYFSHDQTGALMGDSYSPWVLVGAFSTDPESGAVGEIPNKSMPIYTYK